MTTSLLSPHHRANAARVFDSDSKRFTDLVRAAGLDPTRDLRGKTLHRIVIQPDEDVSGYDFTGADLSGAVLRRVDLSGAVLEDTVLFHTDLRGATLPEEIQLEHSSKNGLVGNVPAALKYGKNRLWPLQFTDEINYQLTTYKEIKELHGISLRKLDNGNAHLAEHMFRVVVNWAYGLLTESRSNLYRREDALAQITINDRVKAKAAKEYLIQAIERSYETSDKNYPILLSAEHNRIRAILDQGYADLAKRLCLQRIEAIKTAIGEDSEHEQLTRYELARATLNRGHTEVAIDQLSNLFIQQEKSLGKNDINTILTRFMLTLSELEQISEDNIMTFSKPKYPDIENLLPYQSGQIHLTCAFAADLRGDATSADAHLGRAERYIAVLHEDSFIRRAIACYRRTRTPGGPGGTTLWMIADPPADA
jgi:ribulose bisphosphate carboxylase small subunit